MSSSGTVQVFSIDHPVLIALSRELGGVSLPSGNSPCRLRLLLADWDLDGEEWMPGAGLTFARRQRTDTPELTLICGFDAESLVRRREEGSVLNTPGVAYMRLPARIAELEERVRSLQSVCVGELDPVSWKRTKQETMAMLRGVWHDLRNVSLGLSANIQGLKRAADRVVMKSEYGLLQTLPEDLIVRPQREFDALSKRMRRIPGWTEAGRASLNRISRAIASAAKSFADLQSAARGPFDPRKLNKIIQLGERTVKLLKSIEPRINEITPKAQT